MDDEILRLYVDEIFSVYDHDNSQTLDVQEISVFLNDIFSKMNDPRRFNHQQAYDVLKSIDINNDGKASKTEIFLMIKKILTTPNHPVEQPNYQQPQYFQQQPMNYSQKPMNPNQPLSYIQHYLNNSQQFNPSQQPNYNQPNYNQPNYNQPYSGWGQQSGWNPQGQQGQQGGWNKQGGWNQQGGSGQQNSQNPYYK